MAPEPLPDSPGTCGCEGTAPPESCCAPRGRRNHLPSAGTGLFLGLLASACCWLPLALGGLGLAGGAAASRFSRVRPWAFGLLAALPVLLLAWWIRLWLRWKRGGRASLEAAPSFPVLTMAVLMLSLGGAWAVPYALDRASSKHLASAGDPPVPPGASTWVLATPQFDCAPCAGDLPQRLASTPGVASVRMDFERRTTRVVFLPGQDPEPILAGWKRTLGFSGAVVPHTTP